MGVSTVSAKSRILATLNQGLTLTVKQAQRRFGIVNVSARVAQLRAEGYAIYTNTAKTGVKSYRLGRPSNAFIDKCWMRGVEPKGPVSAN